MFFFKRFYKEQEKTKEDYLKDIRKNGLSIVAVPSKYWKDEEFFYSALSVESLVYLHTPTSVINDEAKFIRAINTNVSFFERYIDRRKENGKSLKKFTANERIMEHAVKADGMNVIYIDKSIKDKKRFALEAVKQNGNAFYWLKDLKKDLDVAREAAKKYDNIVFELEWEHMHDSELARNVLIHFPYRLSSFPEDIKNNKEFIKTLIKENAALLKYAHCFNTSNKKQMYELIKINPESLAYASASLINSLSYNMQVALVKGDIFPYLKNQFKKYPYFQLKALQSGISLDEIMPYLSSSLIQVSPEEATIKTLHRNRLHDFFQQVENKQRLAIGTPGRNPGKKRSCAIFNSY
ncbi:MAG: DUF4116 domain-containing protein [Legionella sp.]|nr:DUF4116 domain-containing protein [Legionella sp.]